MSPLKKLMNFLREGSNQKLAILCVGNVLKGDDGIGPLIAERIKNFVSSEISIIDAGSHPENFISVLRRDRVSHCLIIDAMDFKGNPGDIGFFTFHNLEEDQIILSTHFLSMKTLINLLALESIRFKLLGVQPLTMEFGEELSTPVSIAAERIIEVFKRFMNSSGNS